ncbi:MAG: DnaJ domain-containing protein [Candidatus Contendobacter sp.]|nr:DnaJ domain-containing protein [Candidatus Contendobacter sp.]
MAVTDIIDLVLACYRRPLDYQDRFSLAAPLPEDMDRLLWLATGSPEAIEAGIRRTGAKPEELRDAARFCVQQWCLVRGADPYRVLGVEPGASPRQIKEHHRLLMRLFHPDRAGGCETWTDHYASRINEAWAMLSRLPDHAALDGQSPRYVSTQDIVRPTAERAVDRAGPLSSRHQPRRRLRKRRWRSRLLVWGGLTLAAMMALIGFYVDHFWVGHGGFRPAAVIGSDPPSGTAMVPKPIAVAADPGALGPFLVTPDWQGLERRERQAQQQGIQLQEQRAQWESTRQQQIAAEEALLESMRAERARLEEQVRIEQARVEQARAERLAVEQQRSARVEQARTERELTERLRLEALQADQAKTERLAEESRVERQRPERLKAERARAEQAKSEQIKVERAQAERQRLEELKAEQAQAEQVRLEVAVDRAPATLVTVAMVSEERDLTVDELESLMSRYTQAYQRGDLSSVMALFATGARGRIQGDYATLFTTYYVRGLWLRDLHWLYRGSSASGSGHYELKLRRRDNGELSQVEGSIRFTVRKRNSQILIESIEYDWPER